MILIGLLFAFFENPKREGTVFSSRWFWHGFVFATIFNVAVLYAAIVFPDWMWMYFTNESHNSIPELFCIFVFLYYLPFVGGFYLGLDLNKLSGFIWFLVVLFCLATEAWLILHLYDRYSVVGTREQYYQGTAISLFDPHHAMAPVMNGSLLVMVLYFIWVVYSAKKSGKRKVSHSSISL